MGKKKPNQDEKSLAEEEAIRLKDLAQKSFNSSNLTSALKYASRAHRLCPAVEGVSEMATTFRILHAAKDAANSNSDTDWYRILDLEPFSNINSIKNQYKKLAVLLRPDKNSLKASGEALKLVNDALKVLSDRARRKEFDATLRVALEETDAAAKDTLLTNCSHCCLPHEFDVDYLEESLVCPNCKKKFKALDVADEEEVSGARNTSRVRDNSNSGVKRKDCNVNGADVEGELTLAEMRLKLKKKTQGNKKPKVREDNNYNKERQRMEVLNVEDSDFYDFVRDRDQRSFRYGQVWAIYDVDDGMPRHYARIEEIVSVNPFEVNMSWLNLQNSDDHQSLIAWEKKGFHVSCGSFRASEKDKTDQVKVFSHIMKCERVARKTYRIYPHKGSVWALYKEDSSSNRCYQIVLVLTSYSEMEGMSMVDLVKVDGFRTVFRRKGAGHRAVKWIEKFDCRQFSHQVPAKKLSDDGVHGVPDHLKSCWELDPAALPSDLLTG